MDSASWRAHRTGAGRAGFAEGVQIARKAGLATPMLITAIVDGQSPPAEAILDAMRSVGIRRYRAPSFRYD